MSLARTHFGVDPLCGTAAVTNVSCTEPGKEFSISLLLVLAIIQIVLTASTTESSSESIVLKCHIVRRVVVVVARSCCSSQTIVHCIVDRNPLSTKAHIPRPINCPITLSFPIATSLLFVFVLYRSTDIIPISIRDYTSTRQTLAFRSSRSWEFYRWITQLYRTIKFVFVDVVGLIVVECRACWGLASAVARVLHPVVPCEERPG